MGELTPTCPAVADMVGPTTGSVPSVVCGVLRNANHVTLDGFMHRAYISPVKDGRTDWQTVLGFCCCDGDLPAETEAEASSGGHAHYTACAIWRAEKEREWARRNELRDRAHRRAVLPRRNPDRIQAGLEALASRT